MGFYWAPSHGDLSGELRGRPLRYLLLTYLAEANRPLTVKELIGRCEGEGVGFSDRRSKIVSDALRWEVRAGRVERVARGVYTVGRIPESTMRWIDQRVVQTRAWLRWAGAQPVDVEVPPWPGRWEWGSGSWVPGWPGWPAPFRGSHPPAPEQCGSLPSAGGPARPEAPTLP